MIKIVMTNGCTVTWGGGEYTDYKYDGKFFIIMKDENWIGFYNLDHVISIVVDLDAEEPELPEILQGKDGLYAIYSNLPKDDLKKMLKELNGELESQESERLDNEALAGD